MHPALLFCRPPGKILLLSFSPFFCFSPAAEAVDTDDAHPRGCALDCYVCGAKADARMLRKMAEQS